MEEGESYDGLSELERIQLEDKILEVAYDNSYRVLVKEVTFVERTFPSIVLGCFFFAKTKGFWKHSWICKNRSSFI